MIRDIDSNNDYSDTNSPLKTISDSPLGRTDEERQASITNELRLILLGGERKQPEKEKVQESSFPEESTDSGIFY